MSSDQARHVAFDPRAPEDERFYAMAQLQKAAMPTNSDVAPIMQYLEEALAQADLMKAQGVVVPFPGRNKQPASQGMRSVRLDDMQTAIRAPDRSIKHHPADPAALFARTQSSRKCQAISPKQLAQPPGVGELRRDRRCLLRRLERADGHARAHYLNRYKRMGTGQPLGRLVLVWASFRGADHAKTDDLVATIEFAFNDHRLGIYHRRATVK